MASFRGREYGRQRTAFAEVISVKIEIGRRLKTLRTERGLTQKGLAAAVSGGLDYTYIGKIERGDQLPSLKILLRISEALSVPLGSFFPDAAAQGVSDSASAAADYHASNPGTDEILVLLKQLHEDDATLVTEIIRVLARQRNAREEKTTG